VFLDLFLPSPCVLCSKPGSPICSRCLGELKLQPSQAKLGNLSGFSFTSYNDESSKVVRAIKESGITALIPIVASELAKLWPYEQEVVLVPIPSSPANYRMRGFNHTLLMARALARKGRGISVANILVSGRDRKDQVLLSPKERVENLEAAFRVIGARSMEAPVILLDDVLTTGATLNEAYRTLTDSGVKVDGFCVFAQTGPRNPSK